MINLITNPLLNYVIAAIQFLKFFRVNIPTLLIMETLVILAEWGLLTYSLNADSKRMLTASVAMNLSSFLSGLVFFGWMK
jgi:hypothetical protein